MDGAELQILIYWWESGSRRRALLQKRPFEGEEALFDKNCLLFPVAVFASRIANRVLLAFCDGCHSLALAASHTVGARARPLFFALLGKKFTHTSAKTFKKEVGQFIANGTGFPVLICWGAGFSPSVSLARSTSLVRGRHSSCVTLQVKMEHKKEVQHGKHSRPPSDEGGGAEGDGGRDFLYLNTPTNPNLSFKI